MCLGLNCSLGDGYYIKGLHPLESKLFSNQNPSSNKDTLGAEEAAQLKEGEALVRERYEYSNRMLREMGLKEYDIEKEVKDWQEAYC